MKKFKDFIKKPEEFIKPKDCPDAFFGFFRKETPAAFFGFNKPKRDIKENWNDEDHDDFDDYHSDPYESEHMMKHYHEGDHPEPHHDLAEHYHKEVPYSGFKHYDETDVRNVKKYTNGSYDINHSLIADHNHTSDHIKGLCKTLKKVKLNQDITVHTGSGFSPERYKTSDQQDHIHVHLPAFTSTSISHGTARGFAKMDKDHPTIFMHDYSEGYSKPKITKLEGEDLPKENEHDSFYEREQHSNRIKAKYGEHVSVHRYGHVVTMHVPRGTHGVYVGDHPKFTVHESEYEFLLHKGSYAKLHAQPEYDHKNKIVQWKGQLVHDGAKGKPREAKKPHKDQLSFDFEGKGSNEKV